MAKIGTVDCNSSKSGSYPFKLELRFSINQFNMTQQIQEMDEVKSATVYQKSEGTTYISNEMESESLIAHGGLGNYISSAETENGYAIKTPIVILDDASFQEYCNQIGISDSLI